MSLEEAIFTLMLDQKNATAYCKLTLMTKRELLELQQILYYLDTYIDQILQDESYTKL